MCINFRKSGCLRVGPRCDIMCSTIVSSTGLELLWKSELRCLGVFLTRSKSVRCSLDEVKRGFYRAANSIFGKIGRTASEEVTLHLIKSKCVPILLYGLETLFLTKTQLNSLDFVTNRFLMKLFNTNNMEIINTCEKNSSLSSQVKKFRSGTLNLWNLMVLN